MNMNLLSVISAVKSGNGEELFNQMMSSNPQFKRFVEENQGLTQEQMAQKYGIKMDDINKFLK